MTETYLFAEHVVKIDTLHRFVHKQCEKYRYKDHGNADITIKISQSDIDYERAKSEREDKLEGTAVRCFADSYLESLAVYRKFSESIIDDGYFLFHGSVVAVDGIGYLFTARSGTGKTTHTNLWLKYFGNRAEIINGDKPIIKISSDVSVFGTPWCGKENLNSNKTVPLKAVCILNRDTVNHIEHISKKQAYPLLLQQCYRPENSDKMSATLSLLDKFCEHVKIFSMGCNMELSAVVTAFDSMSK